MKDDDLIAAKRIEDQIGVAANRHDADGRALFQSAPAPGKRCNQVYRLSNAAVDRACAAWASLHQILGNMRNVAGGARAVSHLHLRKRAKAASTSASLASSPRSSWAIASSTALQLGVARPYRVLLPTGREQARFRPPRSCSSAGQPRTVARALSIRSVILHLNSHPNRLTAEGQSYAEVGQQLDAAEVLGLAEIGGVSRHQRRPLLQRNRMVERVEEVMVEGDRQVRGPLQVLSLLGSSWVSCRGGTGAHRRPPGIAFARGPR